MFSGARHKSGTRSDAGDRTPEMSVFPRRHDLANTIDSVGFLRELRRLHFYVSHPRVILLLDSA